MTLLATLIPMLNAENQFTFTVTKQGDTLRIVTNPSIGHFKPDTDDEELAAIQAALVMPLVLSIPLDADPDAALANLLQQAQAIRQPNIDRLTSYNQAQREAQNTANLAKEKKAEAVKKAADLKASGKVITKANKGGAAEVKDAVSVSQLVGGDSHSDNDQSEEVEELEEVDTNDDSDESQAPASQAVALAPVPSTTIKLFD